MSSQDDGRAARPVAVYVVASGRVRTTRDHVLPETLLRAGRAAATPAALSMSAEARDLLAVCRGGVLSLAEAAASLGLPVVTVRILASDLLDEGLLMIPSTVPRQHGPDQALLEKVLSGLKKL